MSNLQAAYAAAFKNVRPSADNLPKEMAMLLTSCWQEDPDSRPNFSQIAKMLQEFLYTVSPPIPAVPLRMFSSDNAVMPPESPGTSSLMAARDDLAETPKTKLANKPRGFFFCFSHCW
ncbi:unnamed protein product [Victoria cruziana]